MLVIYVPDQLTRVCQLKEVVAIYTGSRTAVACVAPLGEAIIVEVESGPSNSRRLYAGIDIAAPWSDVWAALTDYESLDTFIPGASARSF